MNYPIHLLEDSSLHRVRSNGFDDLLDDLLKKGKKQTAQFVSNAQPTINNEIQKIAEAQAVNLIGALEGLIPDQQTLEALAANISVTLERLISENILPQIYNRAASATPRTDGFLDSEAQMTEIYNKAFLKIPTRMTFGLPLGQSITLDMRRIAKAALPLKKFKELTARLAPFETALQQKALPVVEKRVKGLAVFTLTTGMIVGGLLVGGYMALYNSVD